MPSLPLNSENVKSPSHKQIAPVFVIRGNGFTIIMVPIVSRAAAREAFLDALYKLQGPPGMPEDAPYRIESAEYVTDWRE